VMRSPEAGAVKVLNMSSPGGKRERIFSKG
jgi:hypothetical protein